MPPRHLIAALLSFLLLIGTPTLGLAGLASDVAEGTTTNLTCCVGVIHAAADKTEAGHPCRLSYSCFTSTLYQSGRCTKAL